MTLGWTSLRWLHVPDKWIAWAHVAIKVLVSGLILKCAKVTWMLNFAKVTNAEIFDRNTLANHRSIS